MNEEEQNYWEERERENIKLEQMKDAEIIAKLEKIIYDTMDEIERDIESLFGRYADTEGITRKEAKQRANRVDVERMQRKAKRMVEDKDFSPTANRQLKLYNLKMRASREELLKAQLNAHLVAMANNEVLTFASYLSSSVSAELVRQAGILGQGIQVTDSALLALVNASFQGASWSSRIWSHMDDLRSELYRTINNAILRGVHPYRDVKRYRERFDVTAFQARRLLITESARVQLEAIKLSMEKNEIAQYQYIAVIDERTTDKCRGLNREVFDVKDMKIGVNAPPAHVMCRSSIIPYISNWREDFFAEREGRYSL